MTAAHYVGGELELFRAAVNWKRTLARHIRPLLGRRVLEVGAGLGATTLALCDGRAEDWLCLEPDPELAAQLRAATLPGCCRVRGGTIADLTDQAAFDTVLYVDVLEHIADDAAELARAGARLAPGGALVVLSPAHPWLFTAFDAAIGHHRRYTAQSLAALTPAGLAVRRLAYLDSVGLLASCANRLLLRSAMPSPAQIALWDRIMVPASRLLDPVLGYRCGRSVLAVWLQTRNNSDGFRQH